MRLVVLIALLAVLLAACADRAAGKFGEDLYRLECAGCHGADLQGRIGPAIGPGSNAARNLSDEQLRGVIVVGPGSMPGYSRLSDEQVDSLVAYLRERQGVREDASAYHR